MAGGALGGGRPLLDILTVPGGFKPPLYIYLCLLIISTSCCKWAELIEVLFGMWTCGSRRNHVLCGGLEGRKGTVRNYTWECPGLPGGQQLLNAVIVKLLWLTAAGAHADTRAGASSRRRDIVTHWQPVYSLCLWWSSHRPTRYSANRGLRSSGLLSSKVWLIYQARPTLAAFFTNNRRWVHFMSRYCNVRGKQHHRKNGLLGRFCKYSYCKQSR